MNGKVIFGILLAIGLISLVFMTDWGKLTENLKNFRLGWVWKSGGGDKDPSIEDIEDENQRAVDSLKAVIAGYETRQGELDIKIQAYNDSIAELSLQIEKDRKDIQNLRKKANEQVTIASKYSTADIYLFLANRYGEALSK